MPLLFDHMDWTNLLNGMPSGLSALGPHETKRGGYSLCTRGSLPRNAQEPVTLGCTVCRCRRGTSSLLTIQSKSSSMTSALRVKTWPRLMRQGALFTIQRKSSSVTSTAAPHASAPLFARPRKSSLVTSKRLMRQCLCIIKHRVTAAPREFTSQSTESHRITVAMMLTRAQLAAQQKSEDQNEGDEPQGNGSTKRQTTASLTMNRRA